MGNKEEFRLKRKNTTGKDHVEKAKRSHVCFVMHRVFLCSGSYITFIYMSNIVKFKAKKAISKY